MATDQVPTIFGGLSNAERVEKIATRACRWLRIGAASEEPSTLGKCECLYPDGEPRWSSHGRTYHVCGDYR